MQGYNITGRKHFFQRGGFTPHLSAVFYPLILFLIVLFVANIFPLVFSIAVEEYPTRKNEISGLMMMAISGGAVIPLLMGWVTDISTTLFGMSVLLACMIYLLAAAIYAMRFHAAKQ